MHRLALAMLLATPLPSAGQFPVPYGHPPPAPPPVFVAPRAPQLSPFYFNLGIGYGFESWYAPQGDGGVGGLAYHVEAGVRVMPQLLLGFDLSGLTAFGNAPGGLHADSTILGYDAVATLFPFVHGFFLRGGAGLSTLTSVPAYGAGFSYLGTNLLLGAGWAFPLAPPLHLTLGVDWIHPFFGAADVANPGIWMMRVGFGIY